MSAIKSEANAPNNQNGLLRNKTKTVFGVPMVLLVIAASGQLGVAKAYWDEGYRAGQTWAAYGQSWYYQVKVRSGSGLRRFISESMHQKKVYVPFAGSFGFRTIH